MNDLSAPPTDLQPSAFQTHFRGRMTLYAPQPQVADYLNDHQIWFQRCAQPMKAEPLGDTGYVLTIGKFGALGFEVEPQMAVVLEPPQNNLYPMRTVTLPEAPFLGYEVDYQALMELKEADGAAPEIERFFQKHRQLPPPVVTEVTWRLDMEVRVYFPPYIYKLPPKLIQTTGDRLLTEIVRQVSPRLTYKVQKDFHETRGLGVPPKSSRFFERVPAPGEEAENSLASVAADLDGEG